MTWLSDSVMCTRAVLLMDMFSPKNRPMVHSPFHCRRKHSLCLRDTASDCLEGLPFLAGVFRGRGPAENPTLTAWALQASVAGEK